jgi:hypothetical protein
VKREGGAGSLLTYPSEFDILLCNHGSLGSDAIRSTTSAPTAARQSNSTLADLQEQVGALTRELAEAREQQTAASEVLRVISSSPGDLEPVFQAMLANATRLCEAKFGTLYTYDGNGFHAAAFHNAPPAYVEARKREPVINPLPDQPLGRVASTKQVAQVVFEEISVLFYADIEFGAVFVLDCQ